MCVSERAEDRIVEIVDRLVALAHPHGRFGVAFDEGVEHVMDHLGRDARHLGQQRQRLDLARPVDLGHPLGDVLGIIADALDHARDLERGDDVAKVGRHRRAKRDQLDRAALGLDLERIELAYRSR